MSNSNNNNNMPTVQTMQLPATTGGINFDDPKMLEEIKKVFGKDLSDTEFLTFLQLAKATGLNPFLKEIWAVRAGSQVLVMVGINGYFRFANSHPMFDNYELEVRADPKDSKKPLEITALIYRKDRTRPTVATARFSEYFRPNQSNRGRWYDAPFDQLEKCALAKGLRRAFSELHGSYTPEEVETDDRGNVIDAHIVEDHKAKTARQLSEWSAPKVAFYYDISSICEKGTEEQVVNAKRYLNGSAAVEIQPNLWKSEERLTRIDKYQTKEPPAKQEALPIEITNAIKPNMEAHENE